jgi:hypothetical protein
VGGTEVGVATDEGGDEEKEYESAGLDAPDDDLDCGRDEGVYGRFWYPPNAKDKRGFDRAVHGAGEYNQLRKVRTHRSEDAPQREAEGMTLLDVPVRIVVVVVDGICSARLVTGCIYGLFRLDLTGLNHC